MARYFNLGHGTKSAAYTDNFPWPYDIDVCFEPVLHPIAISEGVGHNSAGCLLTAAEALSPQWAQHFEVTRSSWLIPHIQLLSQGTTLPKEEILKHFVALYGKEPDSYES